MAKHREKLLIVDGYNVLRSGSRYRRMRESPDWTDDLLNKSREALLHDVISFAGRDYSAVIVYDGGGNDFSDGKADTVGGVRIMFSPVGSTADKVIEKLAHDARERGIEVLVVTSDATIQDTVFGGGVDRMSSNGFSQEVEMVEDDARAERTPKLSGRSTVASRLSADTLEKLHRLRDGE
jgi:predicted RNA-binding protein with PIN domain